MGSLTKEQLLGTRKRTVQKVPLPDAAMNGADCVYVRKLSAAEAMSLADADEAKPLAGLINACLVGVCDQDGAALFTEEDRGAIGGLDFGVLNRCVEALMELNELTETGSKARKKD
jgi:hypothetical protein